MSPTKVATRSAPSVAEAQTVIESLTALAGRLNEQFTAALDAGDAEAALIAQRALDELPLRRRCAQVVHLKAQIAEAEAAVEAYQPEVDRLSALAVEADQVWRDK